METGRTPACTTGGGTSDARFIKAYCPVIEFGLVNATIHQVDEHVPVADLESSPASTSASSPPISSPPFKSIALRAGIPILLYSTCKRRLCSRRIAIESPLALAT